MSAGDVLTVLPLLILAVAPFVTGVAGALWRGRNVALVLTLAALAATLASLAVVAGRGGRQVTPLLRLDGYALFFVAVLVVSTAAVVVLAHGYLRARHEPAADFDTLLLLALAGSATLVCSTHFASFFLGLEVLSVSLYALIAYPRRLEGALEAALKYLVLAAVTSAFLLFGMALAYARLGTMTLAGLAHAGLGGGAVDDTLLLGGLALIFVGVGFKLALVPFHLWTPDVYQGAPAPVTAFVATVSKAAVFALLLRWARAAGVAGDDTLTWLLTIVAAASMIAGNLLALRQDDVKRLLAYSSIAQFGYLLVAVIAGGASATTAVAFFLVAYVVTTLTAFGVVTVLSDEEEAERLDDYRGLGRRRPLIAAVFAAALLSLAGVPLTAGFVAKFTVVRAGAAASLWVLLVILAVMSAVSIYYYTRLAIALYAEAPAGAPEAAVVATRRLAPAGASALAVLGLLIVALGVYPTPLIRLIEHAVRELP